jgi:hypothetical protein
MFYNLSSTSRTGSVFCTLDRARVQVSSSMIRYVRSFEIQSVHLLTGNTPYKLGHGRPISKQMMEIGVLYSIPMTKLLN